MKGIGIAPRFSQTPGKVWRASVGVGHDNIARSLYGIHRIEAAVVDGKYFEGPRTTGLGRIDAFDELSGDAGASMLTLSKGTSTVASQIGPIRRRARHYRSERLPSSHVRRESCNRRATQSNRRPKWLRSLRWHGGLLPGWPQYVPSHLDCQGGRRLLRLPSSNQLTRSSLCRNECCPTMKMIAPCAEARGCSNMPDHSDTLTGRRTLSGAPHHDISAQPIK